MPGLRHRGGAGLVGVFEMVGRQRAEARGERRAAEVGELVGMQLDRQAERLRRVEDARDLLGREGDALAEAVDGVGQPFGGDGRQHLVDDQVDIGVLVALGFRRQRMRAEEGGARPSPAARSPSRRAARSDFASLSRSSP